MNPCDGTDLGVHLGEFALERTVAQLECGTGYYRLTSLYSVQSLDLTHATLAIQGGVLLTHGPPLGMSMSGIGCAGSAEL